MAVSEHWNIPFVRVIFGGVGGMVPAVDRPRVDIRVSVLSHKAYGVTSCRTPPPPVARPLH